MDKYRVGFSGISVVGAYSAYTSKKAAKKAVVAMARDNAQKGQIVHWYVKDINGIEVEQGKVKG